MSSLKSGTGVSDRWCHNLEFISEPEKQERENRTNEKIVRTKKQDKRRMEGEANGKMR